jgi:hypothetical protein
MTNEDLKRRLEEWKAEQERLERIRIEDQAAILLRMGFAVDELMIESNIGCAGSGNVCLRITHDVEYRRPSAEPR